MPAFKHLDQVHLAQMLRNGSTVKECAEHFGVTMSAISQLKTKFMKEAAELPETSVVQIDDGSIDSMRQIQDINATMTRMLRRLDKLIQREELRTDALDELQTRITENPDNIDAQEVFDKVWNNNLKSILAIQMNSINASAEIRKQIELTIKIAETIYNVQNVQEFQNDILGVIASIDGSVKDKIVDGLKKRRAIRGLLTMK